MKQSRFLTPIHYFIDRVSFRDYILTSFLQLEGLILAQNERWRRGLGMQVERESHLRETSKAAKG